MSVGSISTPARVEERPLPRPEEEDALAVLPNEAEPEVDCFVLPVGGRKTHSS